MKKIVMVLVALISLNFANAQSKDKAVFLPKKNEVKINLLSSLAKFPEISFEHVLKEDISLGAYLGFSVYGDDDFEGVLSRVNFHITPYCRWLFGGKIKSAQKYGSGFFIEGNTSLLSVKKIELSNKLKNSNSDSKTVTKMNLGFGLAVGWKYVTKNDWIGEILLGVGRNFSKEALVYPRFGISIGKRF